MAQNYNNRNQQNAIVPYNASDVMVPEGFNENVDLIIQTYAKDLSPLEMGLFAADAHQRGLSIVKRQIYATKFNGKMTIMVGVDGFRAQAESHPDYAGQDGPYWCGEDGFWRDVWLSKDTPSAAKVGIYRKGFTNPIYAVALWSEYGSTREMWKKFPTVLLAKCAEVAAIRRSFPDKLGGVYAAEEMDRNDAPAASYEVTGKVVNHPANLLPGPPPLEALETWAGDIGLGIEDLNAAATFLRKQESDITTMTDRDVAAVQSKLVNAYQKDHDKFFAWIESLQAVDISDAIDIEPRPITTGPPTDEEVNAALASATPTSLPFDVPDARKYQ